jgi:hypothetical protein
MEESEPSSAIGQFAPGTHEILMTNLPGKGQNHEDQN